MVLFRVRRLLVVLVLGGLLAGVLPGSRPQVVYAAFSLTVLGHSYTQDFNTLAGTGSPVWTNDSIITAWYSNRAAYTASNGNSATGSLYSFGTGAAPDRALGGVASGGTGTILYGVHFVNNTFATITSFDISYIGEQWRQSGTNASQSLIFEYQIGTGLTLTSPTGWTPSAGLNFVSPIFSVTAGNLNGNSATNQAVVAQTLVISVPANQEVMFRWQDVNDTGNDHGLAIDDLSITPLNPTAVAWAGSTLGVDTEQTVAGAELTYSLTVSDSAGGDFSVSDTFDPSLSIVSAPGMQIDGRTVSASGVVASGERRSFKITVRVAAGYHGLLTNSASLNGDGASRVLDAPVVAVLLPTYLPLLQR